MAHAFFDSKRTSASFFPLFLALVLLWAGCGAPGTEAQAPANTEEVVEDAPLADDLWRLRARFVEFYMGDKPHYVFEDPDGQQWDFVACEAEDCDFAMEVPEAYATDANQGWTSNPALIGQWYDVIYFEEERVLLEGQPAQSVQVISDLQALP